MLCEKAGEITAQTRSKLLQLGAIFCAYSHVRTYSKVRRYLLYPSKQLYNPQQDLYARRQSPGDPLPILVDPVSINNNPPEDGEIWSAVA
jgi:hypothetical protein